MKNDCEQIQDFFVSWRVCDEYILKLSGDGCKIL